MIQKKSIREWSEDDRPREKLIKKGTAALSDAELIAILLGSGSAKQSAVELARDILASGKNNINTLGKMSLKELMTFKGVGEAKAVSIVAALELGKRRKLEEVVTKRSISTSDDAFEYYQPLLGDLKHEEFHVLFLTRANTFIDSVCISSGGTVGTVMDIKILMRHALDKLAQSVIVAHNHPSGNNQPSTQDKQITRKIKDACALFEIALLDHIIIADKSYFSFADAGMM
ncbi:MAG: DNA repair protein RadC [Bacteroidales bacterium]|nr:DNA repair protein RadC [Bacteroidales bacterium]